MRYPEWNTWCIGRNLIDLPAGSKVTYGTEIDGAKITPLHDVHNAQQLRELVEKRVEEVKKMPHRKADSMFLGIHDIPGGGYPPSGRYRSPGVEKSVAAFFGVWLS